MTDHLTRRDALTLGAGALAALAGCGAVDDAVENERSYDASAFASLGPDAVPRPDRSFPLPTPDGRRQHHRERARSALDRVPEDPSLPNEVLADELARRRRRVAGRLREGQFDDEPPLERLGSWRHVRGDAVSLAAAWEAATGEFDPEALPARRDRLRSELYDAMDRWDYRAPTAAAALVVHEWVERTYLEVERQLAPWPPVPDDPVSNPSLVGDAAGSVERAAATLRDVEAMLEPVRERGGDGHREAVVAVAHTLERHRHRGPDRVDVDDYVDERGRPNFDRDVEDTPARYAFEAARRTLESAREDAVDHRRDGEYARAAMAGATATVAAGAFRAVVEGIRSGEYEPPADADAVRGRWTAAVDAVERAWSHEPTALSVGLADSARGHLRSAGWYFDESDTGTGEIDPAYGAAAYAEQYAERVPEVVDLVADVLAEYGG
jgi:hypothetical protein